LSKFSIEYYQNYFISWGEATAAARTTGMTEYKNKSKHDGLYQSEDQAQLKIFEKKLPKYGKGKKSNIN